VFTRRGEGDLYLRYDHGGLETGEGGKKTFFLTWKENTGGRKPPARVKGKKKNSRSSLPLREKRLGDLTKRARGVNRRGTRSEKKELF